MTDMAADMATGPSANPLDTLAGKLSRLVPPSAATPLAQPAQSPAVEAALRKSRERAAAIARQTRRSRRGVVAAVVESFVSACAFVPYALVALAFRFILARVFFLAGQTMIDGPRVPLTIPEALANVVQFDFSVTLPFAVKPETFAMFAGPFSAVPVPPALGAYLVSYAQFVLPVLLMLGLATRFSALGLMAITVMIQLFVYPDALWSTHVYWAAMLLMLVSTGPGAISVDHVIRWAARR
jgi:putative oxidoreductase